MYAGGLVMWRERRTLLPAQPRPSLLPPSARWISAPAAVLVAALSLTGCGRGTSGEVVARIRGTTISKETLDHRLSVMAAGRAPTDLPNQRYRMLRQQALESLIASAWIRSEAAGRGIDVSGREIARRISAKTGSFPGGKSEFDSFLKQTGQTVADIELETKTELLSSELRQNVIGSVKVADADIAHYYQQHRRDFAVPEARQVEISNRTSRAAAYRLRRQVLAGGSLLSRRQREVGETSITAKSAPHHRDELEVAIYASRPHALTGPVLIGGYTYYLFRLIRVTPARQRPLSEVYDSIRKLLIGERQRRALSAAVGAWRSRWMAVTDCGAQYVVQKCHQYRGAGAPEDPLNFN